MKGQSSIACFLRLMFFATGVAIVSFSAAEQLRQSNAQMQVGRMDDSSPVGTWYLQANGSRLELTIRRLKSAYSGTIKDEGSAGSSLAEITWDPTGHWLEFRRTGAGFNQWYRLSLVQGVVAGRFSHGTSSNKPTLTEFKYSVTGWSPDYVDTALVPRTWSVKLDQRCDGALRIDRDSLNVLVGTVKTYGDCGIEKDQEHLENQLSEISWNGTSLSFTRNGQGFTQTFRGNAAGRFITGTFTNQRSDVFPWTGARSEVLGFGLGSRLSRRSAWQETTRARLANLTEGMRLVGTGMPSFVVTEEACASCPFTSGSYPAERDDDPDGWPTNYTLKRLRFSVSPGNRFDPAAQPSPRVFYGYLAVPTGSRPATGWRAVVALNGHDGSAEKVMSKNDEFFWYGESAARRSLVVLAIDIGHHPEEEWGPIFHPAIMAPGYTGSDWEEDGERTFSVRLAIYYLQSLPYVRKDRMFLAGLSLGGEVATITSGMDPRIAFTMVAGYSPDMRVMDVNGNHTCYLWRRADIHEYVDVSDYEALIAPRPLVVETGIADTTFSKLETPFAADKQVTRRARAAYGPDGAKLIHYLHYDKHHFHVGDVNPANRSRPRGLRAASVTQPASTTDLDWQTNSATVERSRELYQLLNEFVP